MKIKNLTKRALAFALACITLTGSTPAVDVHAEDTSNSKVDIYATQSSDYLITIPKQLILDGKSGTGAYRVSVKGNISGTDIITVTPDERFFMKQEGKTDILTNIEQIKTQFTYADGVRPEVEVTADGKVQMEKISAGKWTGLFNFNITSSVDLESEDSVGSTIDDIKGNGTGKDTAQDKNSEYSVIDTFGSVSTDIKVSAKNEDGEDINATASTIVGSEAKDLLDGLKETGYIEDTEEVDALIEVESDDFDGIAETVFDVSEIAKPGDEVIILHYDETKQMWEFIGQETVTEDGTVKGDFTSYSPVAFVKVEKGEIKPHFHNFITESMVDATCTTEGLVTYVCDECDHKTDVTLDPLGHNPISSITPPSCTEGGYTTYVCSRCGEEYQDDSVDATGHSYGEWVIVKEATCTEAGSKQKTCSACNDVVTEDITALGHDYKTSSTASSCTEEGYTTYTCNTCGHSYTDDKVPALGHSYGNWVTVKEATCTEAGSKQKTCSACNDVVTEDITALGHDYKTSSTASSCTEEGYTTYTCNTCGHSYTDDKVPALGHSYGNWVTVKEAACTETGSKQKTCSACNDIVTENIAALGHDYKTSSTAPSCTEEGYTTYTCNTCGNSYTDNKVPALGHSYGDYVTTTEATCTADGVKTKTCTVCGNKETAVITKLGHNYSTTYTVDKEATCTTAGSKSQHCSRCSSTQNVTSIPATGHSYSISYSWTGYTACKGTRTCSCGTTETATATITSSITRTATCTTMGKRTYTARFSNTNFTTQTKTEYLSTNASNHTGSVVNGGTSGVHTKYSCCGTVVSTTHSYTSSVQTEPTYTEMGTTKYTCSCGYSYTAKDIPVLQQAGLYDANDVLLCAWEESGINVEIDYTSSTYKTKTTSPYYVITNKYPKTAKVVLPDDITEIGNYTFYNCEKFSFIEIPDNVYTIGEYAFYACDNLKEIEIPDSVYTIGAYAFAWCESLTSAKIFADFIGESMFSNCSSLINVEISDNVTNIGDSAFIKCTSLTNINLPDSIDTISANAFRYCSGLTSIEIPSSVTSIDHDAFSSCTNLTSAKIFTDFIGNSMFMNCSKLTNVEISDSVTIIGEHAFNGCSSLKEIEIPSSVTRIEQYAFNGSGLRQITIPDSVKLIGVNAFKNCSSLSSVTCASKWYVGTTEANALKKTTSISISSTSTAATYLKSTHATKYWVRD